MKHIIFTLSLLVCVILTSTAQTPQLFNYQATLRDNSGQLLVSEDISMRISILQLSPDGTVIYSEDHAVTTNSQGIVNLKIGSGISADEFASINWSNGPYFIKIEIDTEGSANYVELGTTQLLSVPYALFAEKAKSVLYDSVSYWSKDGNNLYYNSGYVGIGAIEPTSLLDIQGNIGTGIERNLLRLKNASDGGMAYTGMLLKTGESEGHSVIQDYGLTYTASTYYDFAGFLNLSNSNRGVMIHANSADGIIKFYTGHDNMMGAGVERMRINASGNVGIGTISPASMLDIQTDIGSGIERNLLQLKNNSEGTMAYTGMILKTGNSNGHSVIQDYSMYYAASTYYDFSGFLNVSNNNRGVMLHANSADGVIKFYTGHDDIMGAGVERMRINALGNIGVGTTSPLNKLSIEGNEEEWPGRILLSLRNQNTGPKSLAYLKIYAGMDETGTSLGHIATTYTANASPADIAGYGILASSDNGIIISATKPDLSPGIIKFFNGQTPDTKFIETMRISENGNIGIGTTSPNSKLEIADGDVYIKDINKGIIMTSPDGQCWRGTINNSGVLEFSAITCP